MPYLRMRLSTVRRLIPRIPGPLPTCFRRLAQGLQERSLWSAIPTGAASREPETFMANAPGRCLGSMWPPSARTKAYSRLLCSRTLPRPGIVHEQPQRLGAQPLDVLVALDPQPMDEMVGQQRDVLLALAQGGRCTGMTLMRKKRSSRNRPREMSSGQHLVGGGDGDAHVHGQGVVLADPLEGLGLQHAQQLDLHRQWRPPIPSRKMSPGPRPRTGLAVPDGAGEGALDVAEEFALQQRPFRAAQLTCTYGSSRRGPRSMALATRPCPGARLAADEDVGASLWRPRRDGRPESIRAERPGDQANTFVSPQQAESCCSSRSLQGPAP